jgi:hypothetical protein
VYVKFNGPSGRPSGTREKTPTMVNGLEPDQPSWDCGASGAYKASSRGAMDGDGVTVTVIVTVAVTVASAVADDDAERDGETDGLDVAVAVADEVGDGDGNALYATTIAAELPIKVGTSAVTVAFSKHICRTSTFMTNSRSVSIVNGHVGQGTKSRHDVAKSDGCMTTPTGSGRDRRAMMAKGGLPLNPS